MISESDVLLHTHLLATSTSYGSSCRPFLTVGTEPTTSAVQSLKYLKSTRGSIPSPTFSEFEVEGAYAKYSALSRAALGLSGPELEGDGDKGKKHKRAPKQSRKEKGLTGPADLDWAATFLPRPTSLPAIPVTLHSEPAATVAAAPPSQSPAKVQAQTKPTWAHTLGSMFSPFGKKASLEEAPPAVVEVEPEPEVPAAKGKGKKEKKEKKQKSVAPTEEIDELGTPASQKKKRAREEENGEVDSGGKKKKKSKKEKSSQN